MRDSSRVMTRHNRKGRFPTPGFFGRARRESAPHSAARAFGRASHVSTTRVCVSVRVCAFVCRSRACRRRGARVRGT